MPPDLAAYHAGFITASILALIAAGMAQLVDDRAAAPTMRRPEPARRREAASTSAAAGHSVSAGSHHEALVAQLPGAASGDALPRLPRS